MNTTSRPATVRLRLLAVILFASVVLISAFPLFGSRDIESAVQSRIQAGRVSRPLFYGKRAKISAPRADIGMGSPSGSSFVSLDDLREFGNTFDSYADIVAEGCKSSELKTKLDEGYRLIDVRPQFEVERIRPKGSTHVPFVSDEELDGGLKSMLNKWANSFSENDEFVKNMKRKYRNKDKLVVACGEGPRSLVACKQLQSAGFRNVEWLAGGLAAVPEGVLNNEGSGMGVGYRTASVDAPKLAKDVLSGAKAALGKLKGD